ncbi:MAG: glycosyltransferase family 4 protein, partial [Candidatus Binatia bacterium]
PRTRGARTGDRGGFPPRHCGTARTGSNRPLRMHLAYLHYLYGDDTALNHVREFVQATRALGHRVDVYAMNLASGAEDCVRAPMAARLRQWLKRRASRFLHEPKEVLWNPLYLKKELKLLRGAPPDVLLVRDHLLTASCVPLARHLRVPLVLEVNSPAKESRLYLDEYSHLPWIPERLEGWKLRRATVVTVVSSALKTYLAERYGLTPDKIVVVLNGANPDLFHPGAPADLEVGKHGDRSPVVGFVGSFQKWHGTTLLARMLTEVAAARPAVRFLLVGDGPEAASVRQAAATLGDRVCFTGSVPHGRIPGLVASMDIGVLADSAFYNCPLKVVEWMAAGKAVVAPRYGPLEDLITDGVHGILFPPRDAAAFRRAVLQLVDNARLRQTLATAAAARACASLSWVHNARRVLSACEVALRQRSGLARAA